MNLRDLAYVRAVARLRHFGLAAEACHVSQPALSSQIKKLEGELGVILFERTNKSVRITSTGEEIARLAGAALDIIEDIRAVAEAAGDPLSGKLELGCIPTIAPYLLPEFLPRARLRLPQLAIRFQEDLTDRLTAELIDGPLDAALLATPPEDRRLRAVPLFDEPFWVVYPAGHALSRLSAVHTEDLPKDELLLLSEGHCFRNQALDVCRLDAAPISRMLRATSLGTLINLVAAGDGITLLPSMALNNEKLGDAIQAKKLVDDQAFRRIYLCFRQSYPREERLRALAREICECLPDTVHRIG